MQKTFIRVTLKKWIVLYPAKIAEASKGTLLTHWGERRKILLLNADTFTNAGLFLQRPAILV
jgi:hypothetical protein